MDELLQRWINPQVGAVANLHHHEVRDVLAVGVPLQNRPQVWADIFGIVPQVDRSTLGESLRHGTEGKVQNHGGEQGGLDSWG